MDLDDEELEATRKLNGVVENKKTEDETLIQDNQNHIPRID